jgi:Flp pilus assembly protein TadB
VLAGDQDRERAAAILRREYVQGRLTVDELGARTARVLSARSRGDLRRALRGLPFVLEREELAERGRTMLESVKRGVMLAIFSAAYFFYCSTLLVAFMVTAVFNGLSAVVLLAFLVAWLVPTVLLSRLWRRRPAP